MSSKIGDGEGPSLSVVGGSGTAANNNPDGEVSDRGALLKLAELRQQHRDLDAEIQALIGEGRADQLQLTRLKKRKLMLRDQITKLEDSIVPDIIA